MKKFILFLLFLVLIIGITFILFEDYQMSKYYMTN